MSKSALAFCHFAVSPLRADASDASETVSQVVFGEVVEILEKHRQWCKVYQFKDAYTGWLDEKFLTALTEKEARRWLDHQTISRKRIVTVESEWGTMILPAGCYLPEWEEGHLFFNIGPKKFEIQLIENEPDVSEPKGWLGVPYLWGGKTYFGVDCSGFTQFLMRCKSINLPRDAYQQVEEGLEIEWKYREPGDLVFFVNENGRVHHVGILVQTDKIIHAHGCVREDVLKPEGIWNEERAMFTHTFYSIKRW